MSKYTKQYFIDKFSAIPDKEIGEGSLNNHCALWHCGVTRYKDTPEQYPEEAIELSNILHKNVLFATGRDLRAYLAKTDPIIISEPIFRINDSGLANTTSMSPKQRILHALNLVQE